MTNIKLNQDEIIAEVEEQDGLDEDRTIGPQDEGDDDPADTTPAEAEELSDEGGEMLKEERERRQQVS
ncbi:MAG: hypothetical protein A3B99_05530 [Candidatus Yanofskybacteria bacterium RIFCSPHIGHO2_02_FULL_44_12b]|uniref:Uncharacterized protein n=1 Tax=Candidatus Yanofskybacteria bacterium GW2011_GWA2_44_9 TaxID=1619025 RepID=A0A0G1MJ02_9BACT|nr:MAG: hypothetical protein UW79_C0034G0003 [Candidatus Yanofskybacteria bacterium GW2011_GWA2_44_9]OGN04932.1 MAG: hypothetical protein A2659_00015 [Candidatus Yanofskybacteria bacterium RIFCSPHIGHO2_01_FULL_44_24]OGN16152.1 MAG: hypothetical protein A3B99_05530 [Candidatus Yanofskybacteria bacterium RIFCSPHIGHO2_02_FULL_44_12b]